MLFFLDTNIFYDDWFMQAAPYRYLFHFMNNNGHSLLLSRVVLQEAAQLQSRALADELAKAQKAIAKAARLNGIAVTKEDLTFTPTQYDLLATLAARVESVTVVDYESVSHSEMVERAIKRIRPFRENEKGYRDTLIWLSLLAYLQLRKQSGTVVFISANKSDFFNSEAKQCEFHADLLTDLKKICPWCVQPYASLHDFVDQTIDKNKHAIDYTKAEQAFGNYVEEEAQLFLATVSPQLISKLEERITPGTSSLHNTKSIDVDVWEGLEDFEVSSTMELGEGDVFIICLFDLRRVALIVSIPQSDYLANRSQFDIARNCFDGESHGGLFRFTSYVRPCFVVTLVYNTNDETSKDFSVSDFSFK